MSPVNFKGECPGMGSHVFQVTGEQRKKVQFREIIDRMQVYFSTITDKDTRDLNVLFRNLQEPTPEKPEKPNDVTNDDGTIMNADSFDKDVYAKEVKQYTRNKKSLKNSVRGIYNLA